MSKAKKKKGLTKEGKNMPMDGKDYVKFVNDTYHLFYDIKCPLEARDLFVSDVEEIVGITATQVINWTTRVFGIKDTEDNKRRSWHRFSALDCMGFSILNELKSKGIPISKTTFLFNWFQRQMTEINILTHYSQGRKLLIVYDWKDPKIFALPIEEGKLQQFMAESTESTLIMIWLNSIITHVIQKAGNLMFTVKHEDGKNKFDSDDEKDWIVLPDIPTLPHQIDEKLMRK